MRGGCATHRFRQRSNHLRVRLRKRPLEQWRGWPRTMSRFCGFPPGETVRHGSQSSRWLWQHRDSGGPGRSVRSCPHKFSLVADFLRNKEGQIPICRLGFTREHRGRSSFRSQTDQLNHPTRRRPAARLERLPFAARCPLGLPDRSRKTRASGRAGRAWGRMSRHALGAKMTPSRICDDSRTNGPMLDRTPVCPD